MKKKACTERNRSGFTLVEMLVVIAILGVFGTLIVVIFTRTLRGGGKTQIIEAIKQNGQSVLEMMDKTTRSANLVVCPPVSNPSGKNLVVKSNEIYIRYRFVNPSPSPNPTTNGLIQQDNPINSAERNLSRYQINREYPDNDFINKICGANDPMDNPTSLTDTNNQTGVSIDNGVFTREISAGYKDQVTIKFDVKPAVEASQVVGQVDPVTFQTTVQLR